MQYEHNFKISFDLTALISEFLRDSGKIVYRHIKSTEQVTSKNRVKRQINDTSQRQEKSQRQLKSQSCEPTAIELIACAMKRIFYICMICRVISSLFQSLKVYCARRSGFEELKVVGDLNGKVFIRKGVLHAKLRKGMEKP